jgi:hypothetical protein
MTAEGVMQPVISRDGDWSTLRKPGGWPPSTINGNTLILGQTVARMLNVQLDIGGADASSIRCAQVMIPQSIKNGSLTVTIVWDGPVKWKISINDLLLLNTYPREPAGVTMSTDELFMHVFTELVETIHGGYFDLLRASALIRQLLLDDPPLAHLVNRDLRIKIRFRVIRYVTDPNRNPPAFGWSCVYAPSSVPGPPEPEVLKQDSFLAANCIGMRGKLFTIKDVIKSCANVRGGVHLANTVDEKDQSLLNFDRVCQDAGIVTSVAIMRGITASVAEGLSPLYAAIFNRSPK